jgi:hypothetical protein
MPTGPVKGRPTDARNPTMKPMSALTAVIVLVIVEAGAVGLFAYGVHEKGWTATLFVTFLLFGTFVVTLTVIKWWPYASKKPSGPTTNRLPQLPGPTRIKPSPRPTNPAESPVNTGNPDQPGSVSAAS